MNAPFTQSNRLGRLSTALGKDVLVLLRFDGADHVNDLFEYHVEALSAQANIDFDGLIGTHASVEMDTQGHGPRAFDGIVTEARWAGVGENGHRYVLTLRPWIWIAGRRRNQRIFHTKTVVQIIQELLKPYAALGDPALQLKLSEDYPVIEYVVQYRESDLAFATRLMERFGISYHFVHALGSHTMMLTDAIENHDPVAGGARDYKSTLGAAQTGQEHFWEWHPERRMTTGAMRLTEYNFKTPHADQEVDRIGDAAYEQGQIESFDWPGDYLNQGVGKDVVGLRTKQERGQDARHRAIGDCTSLGAGMVVTLTGDHAGGVDGNDYLCLSARHAYSSDGYGSGSEGGDGFAYTGDYTFMPVTAPLAPERKTDIPVVHGPQTAVVVGEGEIDCDEYGRILVHFHWDLEKAYSMRCRVSQNSASKGWGGMVIPRIGMEVVVEFLEGDPDKPLVTGAVYNGANMPPYELPKHKTRSTFKTDTHQGTGFNELRFEDENGEEEIRVHAEKDLNMIVRNNQVNHVMRNRVDTTLLNSLDQSFGYKYTAAMGGMTISTGLTGVSQLEQLGVASVFNVASVAGYTLDTLTDLTPDFGGLSLLSEGNRADLTEGNQRIAVGGNQTEKITQGRTVSIGKSQTTGVAENDILSVGGDLVRSVGEEVLIVCGKSRFKMTAAGDIELEGLSIKINGEQTVHVTGGRIDQN